MVYTQAVRRGDIYYINNDRGQIGSEMKKDRPAVVVSNDMNNRYSNEITVVFLTSKPKKNLETHVTVYSTGRESVALCEGITTLDKQRTGKFLGRMSRKEMDAIDKALGVAIGIDRKEEGGRHDGGQKSQPGRLEGRSNQRDGKSRDLQSNV